MIPGRTEFFPEVRGELLERALLSAARLCAPIYRPDAIYTQDQAGWQGDWEGRTLLALVSHWKVLGRKPAYLDEMMSGLPGHLNWKGYLGKVLEGFFDEQQLSGHNWLLRGLLEYGLMCDGHDAFKIADGIVENLYLPLAGNYGSYPTDPAMRSGEGSYSGSVSGTCGRWIVSTDIGCAFMCLDGLSQYYSIRKDGRVLELLREMTGVFSSIDLAGLKMQTHATLSAVRGILRLASVTGNGEYLKTAERVFETYEKYGMTENYANFNWFGRFDSWTEPCAITDSMMAATELYKLTGKTHYLKLAARICFNAFCYAQRSNGGFGTDTPVGPATKYLRPSGNGLSEAFWCCTMRGAEGIAYIAENSVFLDSRGRYIVPFGGSFKVQTADFVMDMSSGIPYKGEYKICVTAFKDLSLTVCVFTGEDLIERTFALRQGERTTRSGFFEIVMTEERPFTSGQSGKKYFYGSLLLASPNPKVPPLQRDAVWEDGLQPLTNMKDVTAEDIEFENRRIVFD